MDKETIERELCQIFLKRTGVDYQQNTRLRTKKCFNPAVGIPVYEMLHVFFDIENFFKISIPEKDIISGEFDSFAHILSVVEKCITCQH